MTNLQHLVSFVQTAEHGSFSAAARVLGLTPAGISKNVARLEAELGVRLFQRSTRRLALTEAAHAFCSKSMRRSLPCRAPCRACGIATKSPPAR
jgi:DNA-binding transcriptional LysR family regulator